MSYYFVKIGKNKERITRKTGDPVGISNNSEKITERMIRIFSAGQ